MILRFTKLNLTKNKLNYRLIPIISGLATISTAMVGISAWSTWNVYENFQTAITKNFKLQDLSGQIVHLDEVLTMSARMAASTGDLKWEERYLSFVDPLDNAIKEVLSIAPEHQENASQTDEANIKLVDMEVRAFELVRQGKSQEALNLLLGQEYSNQKAIYSKGIEGTLANIKQSVENQIQTYGRQLFRSAILAGISFPILTVSWVMVLLLVRSYIRNLNLAQASLEQLNQDLAVKEQDTRRESEILQEDVSQLLDTVCAIEEGDFTVEAPVSDRVTGLVSDTLNRLIEQLSEVLAQVFQATDRVSQGTKQLDTVTHQVAGYAQQEAQSVRQVLELTDKVVKSALDSGEQIQTSTNSLQTWETYSCQNGRTK